MLVPNFKLNFNNKSPVLDVLLHGGNQGMSAPIMTKLFDTSVAQGNSVMAFSFPFFDRGEDHSSGPDTLEEIDALKTVLEYCHGNDYKRIRLIGKSLGGIVASYYLRKLLPTEQKKYSVIILGYILGDIDLKNFSGNIKIIQGEKDKFGNIEAVKNDLKNAVSKNISYFEVVGADHSYRVPETKEPKFEDEAVRLTLS